MNGQAVQLEARLASVGGPVALELAILYEEYEQTASISIQQVSFTSNKMLCELGHDRGFYVHFWNCVSHGSNDSQFVVVVSDVVLAEKVENDPEIEEEEFIQAAQAAFEQVKAGAPGFVELLGEFSLTFNSPQLTKQLYEEFSKANAECEDPPLLKELQGNQPDDSDDDMMMDGAEGNGGFFEETTFLNKRDGDAEYIEIDGDEDWSDCDGMDEEDLPDPARKK